MLPARMEIPQIEERERLLRPGLYDDDGCDDLADWHWDREDEE